MAGTLTTQTSALSTVPSGAVIGTDEVTISSVLQHVQRIKLVDGTDGGTALIAGDATNGLDVDVTRLPALVAGTASVGSTVESTLTGNASVTSAANIFSVDLLGYNSICVQITSAGTTCTVTYEASNDNSTWVAVPLVDLSSNNSTPGTTSAAAGIRGLALTARYFRARVSTYTSGTVTAFYVATAGAYMSTSLPANLGGQTLATVSTVTSVTAIGTSVTPGTSAAHLGKAEDAVAASGDTGVAVFAVRRDAPSSDVSAAGDYATLQTNATGSLWVVPTTAVLDNAAFTDGTTPVDLNGYVLDETAGTALTENDAAAARIDAKRAQVHVIEDATTRGQRQSVNASGGAGVTLVPHTSGGLTPTTVISAASTNATSLKASAGQVYAVQVFNVNAAARYLKLYDKASAPTVGTDTPVKVLTIPGNTAGAGLVLAWPQGLVFATGIAWALTTGVANSDTGAVAANEIVVNLDWK